MYWLEYKSIRETLESVAQSPNSEEEKLSSDNWKSLEEKNWEEEMTICDENIQKMDKILEQILKMKQNFETQIFSFYKFIMKCSSELHTVANEKMKHLSEELDKLEKVFFSNSELFFLTIFSQGIFLSFESKLFTRSLSIFSCRSQP